VALVLDLLAADAAMLREPELLAALDDAALVLGTDVV